MARQLYVQYPDVSSTSGWSAFQNIKSLFANVTYIGSQRIGGGTMKSDGVDIPGIHGIYPTYYKTASRQIKYSFLVRSNAPITSTGKGTATEEDKTILINTAKQFTSWLYAMGELHFSEDITSSAQYTYYNRLKYKSVDDYNILMGAFGLDIRLDVTLVAIDALNYALSQQIDTANGTATASRQIVATTYDYNIADSPISIQLMTGGLNSLQPVVVYSKNMRSGKTRGFTIDTGATVAYSNVIIDSEAQTVTSSQTNLIPYIRPIIASDVTNDNNITIDSTYSYDFPALEWGITRVAVSFAVSTSGTTSTVYRSYHRRWL